MALRSSAVVALLAALLANAARAEDCSAPFCLDFDGQQVRCDTSSVGHYFSHPDDCHRFLQCTYSGLFEMSCGPGTAWDQSILTCAHEATVDSCKAPEICDCDCCFRADPDDAAGFIYCLVSYKCLMSM